MTPTEVFLKFVEQINRQNVEGLCDLMDEDHTFVDGLGSSVRGREDLRRAWTGYFHLFPDYQISCDDILTRDDLVAAFGTARATYCPEGEILAENTWQVPAAWRAVINGDRVREWRVYADNEPARRIMSASQR